MIRVFATTQPNVMCLVGMEPDACDFLQYVNMLGRRFYLARRGPGWIHYKLSTLCVSPSTALTEAPSTLTDTDSIPRM